MFSIENEKTEDTHHGRTAGIHLWSGKNNNITMATGTSIIHELEESVVPPKSVKYVFKNS
jgi:hypothetical protein